MPLLPEDQIPTLLHKEPKIIAKWNSILQTLPPDNLKSTLQTLNRSLLSIISGLNSQEFPRRFWGDPTAEVAFINKVLFDDYQSMILASLINSQIKSFNDDIELQQDPELKKICLEAKNRDAMMATIYEILARIESNRKFTIRFLILLAPLTFIFPEYHSKLISLTLFTVIGYLMIHCDLSSDYFSRVAKLQSIELTPEEIDLNDIFNNEHKLANENEREQLAAVTLEINRLDNEIKNTGSVDCAICLEDAYHAEEKSEQPTHLMVLNKSTNNNHNKFIFSGPYHKNCIAQWKSNIDPKTASQSLSSDFIAHPRYPLTFFHLPHPMNSTKEHINPKTHKSII